MVIFIILDDFCINVFIVVVYLFDLIKQKCWLFSEGKDG